MLDVRPGGIPRGESVEGTPTTSCRSRDLQTFARRHTSERCPSAGLLSASLLGIRRTALSAARGFCQWSCAVFYHPFGNGMSVSHRRVHFRNLRVFGMMDTEHHHRAGNQSTSCTYVGFYLAYVCG